MSSHRADYKRFINGNIKKNYCCSFKLLELDLKPNYDTIEFYECDSKLELEKRERYYIELYKEKYGDKCVNKCIPTRTKYEYYIDNKEHISEYQKKWKNDNKEKNNKKTKEYYQNNKEKAKANYHKNKDKNKEEFNRKQRERYEANKDKNRENYQKNKDKINKRRREQRQAKKLINSQ